jgi:hypothetical protein
VRLVVSLRHLCRIAPLVLRAQERCARSQSPDISVSMEGLASSLQASRRNNEAMQLYEETLKIRKIVLHLTEYQGIIIDQHGGSGRLVWGNTKRDWSYTKGHCLGGQEYWETIIPITTLQVMQRRTNLREKPPEHKVRHICRSPLIY